MNKKILYGVILLSIFLMSAATTVQPVQGYKFGVPDQAKGVEGESEVKIYDKDQWEACFGKDGDEPDDIWDGDSDVVGAKSKGIVRDWESDDEISFFWDFVLETEIDSEALPTLDVYKDALNYIAGNIWFLSDTTSMNPMEWGPLAILNITVFSEIYGSAYWFDPVNQTMITELNSEWLSAATYAADETYCKAYYDRELEGTMVTLDTWEYYEGAYPGEPDEEDEEAPFLDDPESLYDSYKNLVDLKMDIYGKINDVVADIIACRDQFDLAWAGYLGAPAQNLWAMVNYTAGNILEALAPGTLAQMYYAMVTYPPSIAEGANNTINPLLTAIAGQLLDIQPFFETYIPKAAGYLYMALEGGLPVYTPTGKFLDNMVEEFEDDIEDSEDVNENAHPAMEGTIYFEADVDVDKEAMTITMEFDFNDAYDPEDIRDGDADPDELENWEVTFYYGEYGSQNKIEYSHGDEIFYSKESLAVIPGYEITIILGASAVAILGLIYVVMKKRKM
ncbi:MAG: hypothetical protein ACFFAO_04735 [Candidatus Hermodarchaeota archaeon]